MIASEFSREIKLRLLPGEAIVLEASAAECAALAKRFSITAIESLSARLELTQTGKSVRAHGAMEAQVVQTCAISGEDFTHIITEPLAFHFVPPATRKDEPNLEIELDADELDEIEYDGELFDLGEAVAQSLGLAIDPYAEGPNADAMREKAGIISDDAPSGPLAEALAALKKD